MHAPSLIEKKRDGAELSEGELCFLIEGFTDGSIPDYQMSALAMAVFFKGMSASETASLTRAMLESGDTFVYPSDAPLIVDKHSTGGIGDKVSLVLAPLLVEAGVWVPMISGRGLGITGGTLDKLESIPGFRVGLSQEEAMAQLSEIGVVMMGQTASICPADKKLYALRDVTATVPSEPLIIASILSKKLAESLDRLVLDVKFGSGAFMKTRPEAESLGEGMRVVAEEMGVSTAIRYNPMDEPLGRAVGNALEVSEALEVLRGDGPRDLIEITLDLAEAVVDEERETLASWLRNGRALERFRELVKWQGGDSDCLDRFEAVCPASIVLDVTADRSGEVNAVDADTIGRASVRMGAGRNRAEDQIDFSVGFDHLVKIGQSVSTGEVLGRVHARSESEAESGRDALLQAILIS